MALQQVVTHSGDLSAIRNIIYSQQIRHYKAYDWTILQNLGLVGEEKTEDLANTSEKGKEEHPIIVKNDFNNKAGDQLVDQMFEPLDVTSAYAGEYLQHANTTEQTLVFRNINLYIHTLKQSAGWDGEMSQQRVGFSLKGLTKDALENWASRRWEYDVFYTLYNGYSPHIALGTPTVSNGLNKGTIANTNLVYAGVATSGVDLGEGDVLNVDVLERLRSYCSYNRIKPIILKGYAPMYVLLVHTFQYRSLRQDQRWVTARLDGMPRGEKNHPIFENAMGKWGDILVVEVPGQNNIATYANAATGGENYAQKRRALLLGGGAVYYGQVKGSRRIVPLNETDFGDHNAWCIRNTEGMRRGEWAPDPSDGTYYCDSVVEVATYAPNTF